MTPRVTATVSARAMCSSFPRVSLVIWAASRATRTWEIRGRYGGDIGEILGRYYAASRATRTSSSRPSTRAAAASA